MEIRKKLAALAMANAINKGANTMVKLGGENMTVNYFSEGDKTWCEVVVSVVDYVKDGIYKKTTNTYVLLEEKMVHGDLSPHAALDVFADYLKDSIVVYVDQNNNVVDYEEEHVPTV